MQKLKAVTKENIGDILDQKGELSKLYHEAAKAAMEPDSYLELPHSQADELMDEFRELGENLEDDNIGQITQHLENHDKEGWKHIYQIVAYNGY